MLSHKKSGNSGEFGALTVAVQPLALLSDLPPLLIILFSLPVHCCMLTEPLLNQTTELRTEGGASNEFYASRRRKYCGGGGVDPIGDVGMFKTTRDPAVAVVILIVM